MTGWREYQESLDSITRRQQLDVRELVAAHNARERRRRQVADVIVGVVVALVGAGAVVAVEWWVGR